MRRRRQYWLIWWLSPLQWRLRPRWRQLVGALEQLELGPLEIRRRPR